jgi:hypothetical protein
MGIWIELGIFLLVFVFAWHQFHDLKKERLKRELQRERERNEAKAQAAGTNEKAPSCEEA